MAKEAPLSRSLSDLRVLEIASTEAGAFCTYALAGLGAQVTKVLPNSMAPSPIDFKKKIVAIEAFDNTLLDAVRGLAKNANVVVEDLPPGVRTGLLSKLLSDVPGLFAASISPFGLSGPHAQMQAYPLNLYHAAGHAQQIPCNALWPDMASRAPLQAGGNWGEAQVGLLAAIAIVACYLAGEKCAGAIIDCSKQDLLINMNWTEVVRFPNENKVVSRFNPFITFVGGVLPARDGFLQLVLMEDHQWRGTMKILGNPEWSEAEKYRTHKSRCALWQEIAELLAQETRKFDRQYLFEKGQREGVPIAPILSLTEVLSDGGLARRGVWDDVKGPDGRKVRMPRWDAAVTG